MPPSISMSERPYFINEYPEFLEELRLLDRSSFELCYHGMYHGIPGVSNNDELRDISFADACMLFSQMINDAESVCHLPMKRIIRPPAWRMSPGAIMAARICGFKILALSDDLYALETYQGKHLEKDDVVFYTCAPPLRPLQLSQTTEIVYHALEHDQNYLSSQKTDELLLFLKQNIDSINFCFLNEMK